MLNRELNLLVKLTENLYTHTIKEDVNINEIAIDKFIKLASENNLLFHTAKQILESPTLSEDARNCFQKIVVNGEKAIVEVRKSLNDIETYLPQGLIFKTFRGKDFIRIPNDIDVLTKDFDRDLRKFTKAGFRITDHDRREGSAQLIRGDRRKIHIHSRISWAWEEFLDEEVIFDSPRSEIFNGQEIMIPNITADVLIHLAHMNFEPLNMVYSELLYLFTIIPKMNFDLALNQAKKYRWENTVLRTLKIINSLHYYLYGRRLTNKITFKELDFEDIAFPYCFPRPHLVLSVLEKRLFLYPLTRIPKVIKIFLSGDTYSGYISPAERGTEERGT